MNVWTGQVAPCVFCEFRAIFRRPFARPRTRQLHKTAAKLNDHSARPARPASQFRLHRVPSGRDTAQKHHFERNGKPIPKSTSSLIDQDLRLIALTLRSLESLRTFLQAHKASEGSDLSQYDALDPDKTHWPSFETTITSLVEQYKDKKRDQWDLEQRKLWRKLYKAFNSSTAAERVIEIRRTLHFAFADHVLRNQQKEQASFLEKCADLRYPTEWYFGARAVQRDIHLHVGPTNSGKTYNALKRLEESGNGFFAGPLRLLAHEVFSRFKAKGIPCDLVTGDDVRRDDNRDVRLEASTVEMVDTSKEVEVAVIDEIQMMAQEDRGWAWTRAFLGANAKEVHLCGETRVVPLIRELAASMGDTLHIHQYERLNPLKAMSRSLRGNLKNLRKGDCVVSFSIVGIHALKKQIEIETGRRVAIVYGSLPPETRAQQAALFNEPDNDYDFLVASNAIGMGLNLAIKRVVFETIVKYNGAKDERLSVPEIKQIAGRAGRYRTSSQDMNQSQGSDPADARKSQYHATAQVGLVSCLDEADLPYIQEALASEPEPIKTAGILPPSNFVEDYAARLPKGLPFVYIYQRLCEVAVLHPRFKLCDIKDAINIIKHIENVRDLTIAQRCMISASPADVRDGENRKVLLALATCIAEGRAVTVVDVPEIPLEALEKPISEERSYLSALENLHKSLILYLWLSYRYVNIFRDQDMAFHAKGLVEEKINTTLLEFSANPDLRARLLALKNATTGMKSGSIPNKRAEGEELPGNEPDTREALVSSALPLDWGRGARESASLVSAN